MGGDRGLEPDPAGGFRTAVACREFLRDKEVFSAADESEMTLRGIHHCVIMKGHIGDEVAKELAFRGIEVVNLSVPVPSLAGIEKELGPAPKGGRAVCPIRSTAVLSAPEPPS